MRLCLRADAIFYAHHVTSSPTVTEWEDYGLRLCAFVKRRKEEVPHYRQPSVMASYEGLSHTMVCPRGFKHAFGFLCLGPQSEEILCKKDPEHRGVASSNYEPSGWRYECGWKRRRGAGQNMYG